MRASDVMVRGGFRQPRRHRRRPCRAWGLVGSPEERKALLALAKSAPGMAGVRDEMISAY
jgi:hypothetical protein